MKYFILLAAFTTCVSVKAQTPGDSTKILDAVTITGIKKQSLRHTPFNVSVLSARAMESAVNFGIADALAKIPGISQITTGNGISKPVIRGLYGNRIQTVLLGLRFDNQQWQDEHGLGLSIIGIDRIEILKGPSSLLYGTEAIGGVIRIVEEQMADSGQKKGDLNASVYSNTFGFSINGGLKKNTGTKNWRLRFGADSHADYSDGNNHRILNSRFESYNFKASLGYSHRKWVNENHYYGSFSRFGFIMKDNQDRKPLDGRLSRTLDGPYHAVLFNILSSENTLFLSHSRLQINGGIHSNLRLENEGGNHISLNMFLNTYTYNAKWFKDLNGTTELILGNESQFQTNTNYGSRVIIPDAHLFETSLSAYLKKRNQQIDFETGLSVSKRNIVTYYTENMDYSSGAIYPFNNWYTSFNGNAGISINMASGLNVKLNLSTGYRSPNLAELSSNGLHEGTFRYEIGNVNMKAEQNLNSEINLNYESSCVELYAAVFLNSFQNYIYLSPTGTQLYGFDIYRFLQGDAHLYGSELSLHLRPFSWSALETSFSTVRGQLFSGKYLPFIPADKLVNDLVFKPNPYVGGKIGADIVFAQNHPGDFETSTKGYWLMHASIQWTLHKSQNNIRFTVAGENLLNKTYYDHLSRFKYFGIYNVGRNVYASISIPFAKNKQ
ncbi:MAG: TonB-dependent receptor [Flavisolibacter sp.]